MKTITLSNLQARHLILAHHGLWPPYGLQGKVGVLDYIQRVGCIQFDPLNIVSCNPELVLQARVADFRPAMLQSLLYEDRLLLDGWDKNMSIYSVHDWPCFERMREHARTHRWRSEDAVQGFLPPVREALEARGPLSSLDLDFKQTVDWYWAPTSASRAALERMYFWGELIIHHKVKTRRVYDFAKRHLPAELLATPDPNPTLEEHHDWYVLRRMGGIGLLANRSGDAWLGIERFKGPERNGAWKRLTEQEKIVEIGIEGLTTPFYMRTVDWERLNSGLDRESPALEAAVLAPLDNMLWDRRLVKELFNFDYRWEVYKPVEERQYGYYVLPILCGDRLVARFEPGHDRKHKTVVIKNWWWEPGVTVTAELQAALRRCFQRFVAYLDAEALQIQSTSGVPAAELQFLN